MSHGPASDIADSDNMDSDESASENSDDRVNSGNGKNYREPDSEGYSGKRRKIYTRINVISLTGRL